jgi:ribosomal protein S18 acetylase RimI-like enzyme
MEDRSLEHVYLRRRLHDQRALFQTGRGGWYVARDPVTGEVVGSLGIVVTGGRARFQSVDTAPAHQRRGICSRLVVEAARDAAERWSVRQFVIAAAAEYHALGLYESLGFQARERVAGVCRRPPS